MIEKPIRGDCLIWVGQSYPTIDDFVAEARRLGCSRKVPFWPAWLGPGSRIFLAHHGGLEEPEKGVVFGYFALGGVDVIFEPHDYDAYRRCRTDPAKTAFWSRLRPHGGLPVHLKGPDRGSIGAFLADFHLGSEASGAARRPFGCGFSTLHTTLAGGRHCGEDGLRYPGEDGHPTFYLVDELAREISVELCGEVEAIFPEMRKRYKTKKRAFEQLRKEAGREGANGRQLGIEAFGNVVARVQARRPGTPLTLFAKPYPVFVHWEHAWFRGVTRIDGNALLDRIHAAGPGGTIVIPVGPPAMVKERAAPSKGLSRRAVAHGG